jgi:hypothetical protein
MTKVELIYDAGCPNLVEARERLRSALDLARVPLTWQEWDRSAETSPQRVRLFGSPTILIDGKDVAGVPPSAEANCCRIYVNENGAFSGVPSTETVVLAIRRDNSAGGLAGGNLVEIRQSLAALPAIGTVMIPGLSCPACWPAYAGLLSVLGIGFVDYTPYLFSVTLIFLALAVFALGYRAGRRRGYRPLLLGAAGAVGLVLGKFSLIEDAVTYSGMILLVTASAWNAWPINRETLADCPACKSAT